MEDDKKYTFVARNRIDGKTYDEIADMMNVSKQTIANIEKEIKYKYINTINWEAYKHLAGAFRITHKMIAERMREDRLPISTQTITKVLNGDEAYTQNVRNNRFAKSVLVARTVLRMVSEVLRGVNLLLPTLNEAAEGDRREIGSVSGIVVSNDQE